VKYIEIIENFCEQSQHISPNENNDGLQATIINFIGKVIAEINVHDNPLTKRIEIKLAANEAAGSCLNYENFVQMLYDTLTDKNIMVKDIIVDHASIQEYKIGKKTSDTLLHSDKSSLTYEEELSYIYTSLTGKDSKDKTIEEMYAVIFRLTGKKPETKNPPPGTFGG